MKMMEILEIILCNILLSPLLITWIIEALMEEINIKYMIGGN